MHETMFPVVVATLPDPAEQEGRRLPAPGGASDGELTPPTYPAPPPEGERGYPPLVEMLLADKRSAATRKAYEGDLRHFFGGRRPTPTAVEAFLALPGPQIAQRLALYKGHMLQEGLAEATVNRRLSAVRSLLKFACRLGLCQSDGRGLVDGEKVKHYRDTRGVDLLTLRRLLQLPGTDTLRGLRDTALLRLLAENALRRSEVCSLTVGDFEAKDKRLLILGKGRGTQKESVTISPKCAGAIAAYLAAAGHGQEREGPLFRNLDRRNRRRSSPGLAADGLHFLVSQYGRRLGLELAPHKIRHSAITAALNDTGGDVRAVQKLSRHADLNTVLIYDDSREDRQGQITNRLSRLL